LDEFIHKFLICSFISLRLFVVFLKLNNFLAALGSLGFLNLLEGLLSSKGSFQKLLISCLFSIALDGSKFFLSGIVIDQFKIPLSVKDELLSLCFLVSFDLLGPLPLKHVLLSGFFLSINLLCLGNGILLPGENIKSLLDLLFLDLRLVLLSLNFLLVIKHPQLGVDLLLNN
jgi:hypothetical protein